MSEYNSNQNFSSRKLKIVLCYSSRADDFANRCYAQLERYNLSLWFDRKAGITGERWKEATSNAINSSDVVVLFLNKTSPGTSSLAEQAIKWVIEFYNKYDTFTVSVIPIKLEDCDLPYGLEQLKAVNYYEDKEWAKKLLLALNLAAEQRQCQPVILPTPKDELTSPIPNNPQLNNHFEKLLRYFKISNEWLVPVLGPNINLYGRVVDVEWTVNQSFPPTSFELAGYLAQEFEYLNLKLDDLARVSQYAAVLDEPISIHNRLHALFEERSYQPNQLHRFFATLPALQRRKFGRLACPILITTNYDDLLERAFDEQGEPYDLMVYKKDKKDGYYRFFHRAPGKKNYQSIPGGSISNRDSGLELEIGKRPIIVKLHHEINLLDPTQDSWVVTEDDFINMARSKVANLLPNEVITRMRSSHLLFLGYTMQDWSLRVILWDIWDQHDYTWKDYYCTAVEFQPDDLTKGFWEKWDVKLVQASLENYLTDLQARLEQLPDRTDWGL